MNRTIEVRDIIKCPECGHTEFIAKAKCDISVKFYMDNGLIYPKTDVFDIDDDTIKDIECVKCNNVFATSIKDLNIFVKTILKWNTK